jgi:hypothetical protein
VAIDGTTAQAYGDQIGALKDHSNTEPNLAYDQALDAWLAEINGSVGNSGSAGTTVAGRPGLVFGSNVLRARLLNMPSVFLDARTSM